MEYVNEIFIFTEELIGRVSFVMTILLFIWNTKLSKKSRAQAKEIKQVKEKSEVLLNCLLGSADLTYQVNGGKTIAVDNLTPDKVEYAATEQRVLRDFQARNGRIFADNVERVTPSHFKLTVDPTKLRKDT